MALKATGSKLYRSSNKQKNSCILHGGEVSNKNLWEN